MDYKYAFHNRKFITKNVLPMGQYVFFFDENVHQNVYDHAY